MVGGKLEVDALTLLFAKVNAMTQRLDRMNVNAVNSSAPSPCEICGSIEHVALNCRVGIHFSQDPSQLNYVFQRPPFPSQMPRKSNLVLIMESMLTAKQK